MLGEKETYKSSGILEVDTFIKAEMKKKMDISDEWENFSKSSSSVGNPSCKILGIILEMDKGWTSTNRPEYKEAKDDA